jgi:hypothetical protein
VIETMLRLVQHPHDVAAVDTDLERLEPAVAAVDVQQAPRYSRLGPNGIGASLASV